MINKKDRTNLSYLLVRLFAILIFVITLCQDNAKQALIRSQLRSKNSKILSSASQNNVIGIIAI